MKAALTITCLPLLLLLAVTPLVEAQAQVGLPSLTVQNAGQAEALELRSVSVSVRLEGWLAETVLELEFFNHTRRRQEGEFALKLPDNATVSTYALDIQGHMRPGVSVEKEKARNAYESIKARRVDPGLVEREANNVYRTRIFPIEPNQPKRVRIGFIHPLGAAGEYVLPLRHGKKLKNFDCKVSGAREKPQLNLAGLADGPIFAGFDSWEWKEENILLGGVLRAVSTIPQANEPPRVLIQTQPDGGAHFLVQGQLPQGPGQGDEGKPDEHWKKVRLIWDTSLSGGWRDHAAEFKALQRIWQWIGDGEVHLQLVGLKLSGPKIFQIRNGKSPLIQQELRKVDYDGAANFSRIESWDDGVTLLVSDGRISSPMWDLSEELGLDEVFLLDPTGGAASGIDDPTRLNGAALRLDLSDANWWQKLTESSTLGIHVRNLVRQVYDITVDGESFAVSGRLPRRSRDNVSIHLPGGSDISVNFAQAELDVDADGEWTFARRIWAQRRLATLEERGSRRQIMEFSEAERLVSDFTSLIVLEQMSDHIRYRIPPPEPELREIYLQRISDDKLTRARTATTEWEKKIAWHREEFPWIDVDLSREVATVSVWVKSARIAFPDEKLNKRELKPYDKWLEEARKLVAVRDSLNSAFDYHAWVAQLEEKLTELTKLRDQAPPKKAGDPLHVSVRGFVNDLGVFSVKKGEMLTLRDAIERAGGPNMFGSWSRVFLYRDARRTGYNMESKRFVDPTLQWGDMVVMEREPSYRQRWGNVDPFFGGGSDKPTSPIDRAAVFEDTGSSLPSRRTTHNLQSLRRPSERGQRGSGNNADAPGLSGRVIVDEEIEAPKGIDQEIVDALRDHADPQKHYRQLLRGDFGKTRPSSATIIEIARVFFERKQALPGERMLTNLMEVHPNPVEATRSYAYWLAEFGRNEHAVAVLDTVAEVVGEADPETRALVYYDAGRISGDARFYQLAAEAGLAGTGEASELLTIALTDHFALGGKSQNALRPFRSRTMSSDVRVVITWAGGGGATDGPVVEEPDLLAADIDHGAWIRTSDRVYEYQMRRALPGKYQAKFVRNQQGMGEALTVRVDYYLNWAKDDQQRKTFTLLMEKGQLRLPDLEFGWADSK